MSNVVYLDRGWEAGIGNDDPVVSAGGVVGRIILVSRYHCQVQLITNPDASIGVMVERTRSPGVLKGSGDHRLTLDYISNAEQVNVGDVVISSGLDRIYPKGLLVGRVAESHKGKSVFRVIQVEPSADLLHLEDVLVVTGNPKPDKDAGAAPVNR
jgi:rod shape-determining protein MreC